MAPRQRRSRPHRAPAADTAVHAAAGRARALMLRHAAFEGFFEEAFDARCPGPARLVEAMRYAALGPGKRLRPLLVLTACEGVGGRWRRALPAAVAVECVHAFSLVHDDLPAMDDDDYRRGRLTTHRRYGEALGILAGDALLAFAFEELSRLAGAGIPALRVIGAMRRLAHAAGAEDLVGGQALDMAAEGRRAGAAAVERIHMRKTGALMGACLALGAIAGGAADGTVAALDRAGRGLGTAFQIRDDLLNAGSTLGRLGKRAGSDAARGKATYPRAAGPDRAVRRERSLLRRSRVTIQEYCPEPRNLLALLDAVAARQK